jgi:ABC-type bacteriocin/lantibiotic exporter with double-glycine peptidase domain
MKILIKTFSLTTFNEKIGLSFILLLMFFYMALELLSIGILVPLISVLANINPAQNFLQNEFTSEIIKIFTSLTITNLLFLFAVIFIVKNLFIFIFNYIQAKIIFKIRMRVVCDLYQKYLNQNFYYFSNKNSSEIQRNVSIAQNFSSVLISFLNLILECAVFISIFIFLLFYNYKVGLIVFLAFFIIILLIYILTKKKIFEYGKKSQYYDSLIRKNITENVANIKEIKLYKLESFFLSFLSKLNTSIISVDFKIEILQQIPRIMVELLAVFLLLLILLTSIEVKSYSEIIPLLAVYMAAMLRLMPASTRVSAALQRIKFYSHQIYILVEELKLKLKKEKPQSTISDLKIKSLKLNNISFGFNKSKYLFQNINLTFNAGTINCITGSNGSGKSTLISIILDLLKPTSGHLLINNSQELYKKFMKLNSDDIGYVPQTIYLIDDTIKNNIIYGNNLFNKVYFDEAVNAAQLTKVISSLPNKEETIVGERGTKMSGGQIQKIAIARCIYRNPNFIVLDEFNNNLDKYSEKKLSEFLVKFKKNRIIIIINHKKEVYKYCDNIYFLNNKKIIKIVK